MKESYHPPLLRSILLGILAFALFLALLGYLGDITKWLGEILYFLPAQVGLVQRVTPDQVIPLDFDSQTTYVDFPAPGRYQLYVSDLDLLMIADTLSASGKPGWLVVYLNEETEERAAIVTITRGLALYDTPFARGRPLYSFEVPAAGRYLLAHPARPTLAYLTPDYTTGHEGAYILVVLIELGLVATLVAALTFRRRERHIRPLRARREEQRARAEELFQRAAGRKKREEKDRWSNF